MQKRWLKLGVDFWFISGILEFVYLFRLILIELSFSGNSPFSCSNGQILKNGTCTACSPGFVPAADRKTCKDCPPGEVPDKDGMKCVSCSNPDEITKLGECEACPSTHIPDYSRKKCVTCNFPKVSKAGNCIRCPACESMYYD